MTIIILAILGLCLGSFINALTWRIHEKKDWVKDRSQCPNCGHTLAARDLVPVLSWLVLRGRCRYCGKPISAQYPVVELAMAVVFITSYLYWPTDLAQTGNLMLFITWLVCSVGLMALLIYDFRWMLLPSKLIYPTLLLAAIGNLIYLVGFSSNKSQFLLNWLVSVAVASGIFWLLFVFSKGKWIGYGDVRLGLITGTLLHQPALSLIMILIASLLGTLFVLPSIISGNRSLSAKLPYGPFLIIATGICMLFGQQIVDWYSNLFILN